MSGPRLASSVSSTLGGWTVSPLTSSTPSPNRSRAHHSEYALFQILGLVVEDELERDAVALLQRGLALLDGARGVAGDDRDVVEPGRLEVAQRDVEDGPVPVDGHQRLGQRVGVGRQAAARPLLRAPSRSLRVLLLVLVHVWLLGALEASPSRDRLADEHDRRAARPAT